MPPQHFIANNSQYWLARPRRPYINRVVMNRGAPGDIYWCATLLSVTGDHFKEGVTILDYGCGNAKLANLISCKLEKFEYYGLEPKNSRYLNTNLYPQQNIHLGYIGDPIEQEALQRSEVVILGSVFTHLDWDTCQDILNKFLPLVERGGIVVFSCFLHDEYKTVRGNHYPNVQDVQTYHFTYLTEKLIQDYAHSNNVKYTISDNYYRGKTGSTHRMVRIERLS